MPVYPGAQTSRLHSLTRVQNAFGRLRIISARTAGAALGMGYFPTGWKIEPAENLRTELCNFVLTDHSFFDFFDLCGI
jgi:hypothetical protein